MSTIRNYLCLTLVLASACWSNTPAVLRPADPAACKWGTVFFELKNGETVYRLNTSPFDSAKVATFFLQSFAQRPDSSRIIMVRADSNRGSDLQWLLQKVATVRGRAYAFDPKCRLEMS